MEEKKTMKQRWIGFKGFVKKHKHEIFMIASAITIGVASAILIKDKIDNDAAIVNLGQEIVDEVVDDLLEAEDYDLYGRNLEMIFIDPSTEEIVGSGECRESFMDLMLD